MALTAVGSSPNLSGAGTVYWIGSNGNVYYKNSSGAVQDMGKAAGTGTTANLTLNGAKEIADPNPGGASAGTTRTGTPAGSGAAAPVLNTAAIDATNQALGSLGTEQDVGYHNVDDSLRSVTGKYDAEAQRNEGDYTQSSDTNATNLQKNKQNALVAGAQGKRGLYSTLAAMGALGGTGRELADRTVTDAANNDIGEAADTFAGNQTTLDKSIRNFRDEDKQRRAEAQTSATNQKTALEGSIASKRQSYYQKLADLFSSGGNSGEAARYLGLAGGLNNEIASKSRVAATPITERSAVFAPGELDQYLAGAGDMTVDVTGNASGASNTTTLLAARAKDKEKNKQLVAA